VSGAERHILGIGPDEAGRRVDVHLATALPALSRNRIQRLIQEGRVRVNGRAARAGERTRAGSWIEVEVPEARPADLAAEDIPLAVVYEDSSLIVVDKPPGMVVHPAAGNARGTLVNALLYHCPTLSGIGGVERPGIVHRIDKGTSGLLVAAKDDRAHRSLAAQFKAHTVDREYLALVVGLFKESRAGKFDRPVGRHPRDRKRMSVSTRRGRPALTRYRVERETGAFTLLRLSLGTGRTHQIRVHLSAAGHPVVGDRTYGGKSASGAGAPGAAARWIRELERPALHAAVLGFEHPVTGERLRFESPLPRDIRRLLARLSGGEAGEGGGQVSKKNAR
jgi:23S rRNA pseudouridine1911/1915/1917 synthase